MNSFSIVRQFEQAVAAYAGSMYAIAMNTCTSALFLSMKYVFTQTLYRGSVVQLPAKTFISVPMAVLHAGGTPVFEDYEWHGIYRLDPHPIIDGALRFRRGMYEDGLHCLSFHARKLLNIGEGGMVLTNDQKAADWLRKAAYSGRGSPSYRVEDIDMLGWQAYMTPEKAARGLHLMEYIADDLPDQEVQYPDLRQVPLFRKQA